MRAHGVAWQIGGTAGEGVESGGEAFARALAASGYVPSTQRDFPSRIRGGDTTFTVRLTPKGRLAPPRHIDLAVAFNATVLPRIDARLGPDSILLLDDDVPDFISGAGAQVERLPFGALAKEAGLPKAKNMVALGASAALMGLPLEVLAESVAGRFARKGEAIVAANKAALRAGHEAAQARFGAPRFQAPAPTQGPALWISGNEAAALGALTAGCRVAAAYPITPASDILEYMTPRLQELGGVALQMEDEVAALNVCIGAGFTGARSLTATSGPGLSLMTESIGLAGSAETPCVIVDCQRPGPSTGMPTKHGQEDLWHMIHGGHGEFVRVVLAPTDVRDAFVATSEAFRLAEAYRCPAFVALDQQASLFKQTIAPFDLQEEASRHGERDPGSDDDTLNAWDGSYRPYGGAGEARRVALPGEAGGVYYSNSTEHAPTGFTNEQPAVRERMVERRLARMEHIIADCVDPLVVEGDGDVAILSWGSTVDACREARDRLVEDGRDVRVVGIRLLWPFPKEALEAAVGDRKVVIAEANAFAQLSRLVRSELPWHDRITEVLRYDGTPLLSDDVLEVLP